MTVPRNHKVQGTVEGASTRQDKALTAPEEEDEKEDEEEERGDRGNS